MTEGPRDAAAAAPASFVDKLIGILVTVALVSGGLAALALIQVLFERRDDQILRTIPDVLLTWREPADLFLPMMLIAIAPLILAPGFFGLNRTSTVFPARTRWRMVALAAGCVAASVAWGALAGREEMGVATRFGAAWLRDGKPIEHWSWGAATSVGAACVNQRDEATGKVAPALNYDVTFPSGREASLARDVGDVRTLLGRLAPIDESLRARSVPRFVSTDAGCMAHYGRGLSPDEQARLRGLLGR
ncbi:hypothetical protein [Caulobacter sp. RL271]|jgi:hypothetical protein|uniref:Uncharacterized protein n=1 Tax=Caulobacter segnis TaxID=88688 RepID=A0ABY4ZRJ9_9CAUL|nr:hypothetical protein [Caulobacter segnis]USQ95004.1 hypothetical protein MZV50_20950 [Caulobacter segnis]